MANPFTLDDFRKQLEQMARPGLLEKMLWLIPGMGEMTKMLHSDEHKWEMRRLGGMIDSMTPAERNDPKLIDPSRRQRIADGSGVSPREVTDLIKQFESMASLMEAMTRGGTRSAIDKMRELRRGEVFDDWEDDDDPWDDDDILGRYDHP
ncbi:hypothetical protein C5Y96_16320 [Blastopirellula marina]|uniref:Signal recognition particle SRP54 subunit M-domain domain-containing protein n=1 Tax=Blastopirellula marina TaxID=124 RepID=A0A2S8F718_9BACT|nr:MULTISPECIES: hypothetical protein [Pirellulaceae]PQO27945.1 hypothetical protein C5Y96_16320 [Blastopirellula marina]RCS48370.1 hypothetical protein DTL36_16340 [Bremerella cremea]